MKIINNFKYASLVVLSLLLFACDSQDTNGNRVSLGTSNTLFSLANLQYQEQFVVQVTNSEGDPSANTRVTFKLQPLSYNKGFYAPTDINTPPDGTNDRWEPAISIICNSEDTNNNGSLDASEDVNANGKLDPAVPAITAHPDQTPTILPGTSSLITDDNGFGYLAVTYPKSESSWVRMQLTGEALDGLPGNIAQYSWTLRHLIVDISDLTIDPPGGINSPYGTIADCTNPD
jgi:hypothetical protein